VVLVFAQPVTFSGATVTPGSGGSTGSVTTTPATGPSSEVIVNFTASNAQTVTVNLLGVSAGGGPGSPISVPMSILLGDTFETGTVNSSDIGLTKGQSGNPIENANFRHDVTVNGAINSSDIGLVKIQSGTGLPSTASRK
jgi:hypothetical protein